jgi:hypothetical protein
VLLQNEARRGVECLQHHRHQDMNTFYSDFLAIHPPIFSGVKDPLEKDDWLRTMESMFSLLHRTEYQKTLYAAQQLRGPVGPSGHPTLQHCQQITMYHGMSFMLPSVVTTCQWAQCAASFQSFWIYARGTIQCMSTLRSSTTWHNTKAITLTRMRRRPSSTAWGS